MTIANTTNLFVEYNPVILSIEGITFLLKKENLQLRVGAIFFSVISAMIAYFISRFAVPGVLPYFLAVLTPLEFAAVTFTATFLMLSVSFGIMSKGRPQLRSS